MTGIPRQPTARVKYKRGDQTTQFGDGMQSKSHRRD
jgi:hypothetical protein